MDDINKAWATKLRSGTADCDLHLSEGKPVKIQLKLGRHNPLDWADQVG